MHVRFIPAFDASKIFNLASPRYVPEISKRWKGRGVWWSPKYEPVRDLIESRYVELFNETTGHYRLLEEDIRTNGIRNPVMVSCGRLLNRGETELPPHLRGRRNVVCEYVGGSRVYVAQKLGLSIPVVVNDAANAYPTATTIPTNDDSAVFALFPDKPRKLYWSHDGSVYANFLPYSHFPAKVRQQRQQQQRRLREKIVQTIFAEVVQWLKAND